MALSTSRTVITQSGLTTTQSFNVGGILAGTSNLHTVGIEIAGINVLGADTPIGSGSTIYDDGGARFSGIITATSFHGDISQATGAAAGLGTALSQTQTDPLNKVYYTNRVLSISTTTTVDPPATASAAYTQYTDLSISNGADLIIKDGDELVPDVLGLSTTALPTTDTVTNTGGRLRVGQITNANANGAPNFPNGLTVTGIVTASTLNSTTSQIVVGSAVTANITGIDVTGIITATSFGGSLKITDGTTSINKHSVGVGTTTTAGRNAGVSTALGTLNFNTTLSKMEYYNGTKWLQITDNRFAASGGTESTFGLYTLFAFTSNGTFTVAGSGNIDILVVAGGGQGGLPNGGSNYGGGGGAGGLVWYTGFTVAAGDYSIVVGDGGAQTSSGSGNRQGNDGADSTAFGLTAKGGGGGGGQGGQPNGRSGGSGGGAGYTGGASGGASATQSSQSNTLSTGTLVHNLGNAGGNANASPNGGGGGGGAGGAGFNGTGSGNPVYGGAGYNMSSLLGTAVGDNGWFSGGGGGSQQAGGYAVPYGNGGNGLYGGGGRGDTYNSNNQTAGSANTGGGGGAGTNAGGGKGGGSGVVIIRVLTSLL